MAGSHYRIDSSETVLMHVLIFLGLCSGYVPDDPALSNYLCVSQMEAKQRAIIVPIDFDDFEREYFNWQISKLI